MEALRQLPRTQPPLVASVGAVCLLAVLLLLYRAALPKPLKGIPYNHHAAKRILGDIPDALAWHKSRSELFTFISAQVVKLDSPIIQLFMRPFGRPWVIIADFRESQDIMVRRTREFDRSDFFGDIFAALLPHNQVHMKTNDEWRAHRRLVADTMSNSFLNDVAGPQIYDTALDTIQLWKEKARLACDRPFSASSDVSRGALDAIWAATFGSNIGVTKAQLKLLAGLSSIELPKDRQNAVEMPTATDPEAFQAIITLCGSVEISMNSPVPRLHHSFALRFFPTLVSARRAKDELLRKHLDTAWKKFCSGEKGEDDVMCALDLVVQREAALAKKEGRLPEHDTPSVQDELFGFLAAGHDTTSTTICWGLKFMTNHQAIQQNLRSALRTAFQHAKLDDRNPTIQEIVKSNIPYLDATLEEIHRCAGTASSNVRRAIVDTEIWGHHIPKGTDVFLLSNGSGYVNTPLPVDESKRSQSTQDSKDKNGMWDVSDIGTFMPERWLAKNAKGEPECNSRAGPAMPFGAGPRGCFGRKLATLELRIVFTLILWNFELLPTPPELSSFLGRDGMTHAPQQFYLRLAEARLWE